METPILDLTVLPDKQPYALHYSRIVGVTRIKKQDAVRYTTVVYIDDMEHFIFVAESFSEVRELWGRKAQMDFYETDKPNEGEEDVDKETNIQRHDAG